MFLILRITPLYPVFVPCFLHNPTAEELRFQVAWRYPRRQCIRALCFKTHKISSQNHLGVVQVQVSGPTNKTYWRTWATENPSISYFYWVSQMGLIHISDYLEIWTRSAKPADKNVFTKWLLLLIILAVDHSFHSNWMFDLLISRLLSTVSTIAICIVQAKQILGGVKSIFFFLTTWLRLDLWLLKQGTMKALNGLSWCHLIGRAINNDI